MNQVILIGRTTKEPELKFLQTGLAVCNFTLAIDKNLSKDKKQEYESKGYPTADFINIVVYGKQAENCANYLDKGRLTAVQGRIQTRSYEAKDGTRRYVTEVVANHVEFLEWSKKDNDIEGFSQVDNADLPF
ncbi:single-stranded DNA-binding protein [Anaerosalibacter massiliensis]|uniref:single-stranded DNA-binding protein n=1 Tax=Anaerosalibacter massiliensis TaxID=1347392 RepID=UPI0005B2900E|nr:single-stranded DNA-binding protein [Anaerosalibacter massiliensis]